MQFLFFKEDDLKLKDHGNMKQDFNTTDDFLKFVDRERRRVEGYILKVKEKRQALINEEAKAAFRRQQVELRKKDQIDKLVSNEKRLKQLEVEFQRAEQEARLKKEKEEKDRLAEEAERKKRWEKDAKEWDQWDRERSVHAVSGNRLDKSVLSKSFYRRNKSLAELKFKVRPRIENMSVLVPRTQEYREAHFQARKIKDIIQLSEKSQNTLRAKQLKELEFIVNTELNIKKKQEEKDKLLQEKIELSSKRLGYKLQRHEQKLEKMEHDRLIKIKMIHFDRQQKIDNIERAQRSAEYKIQVKHDKMVADDEQFQEMRQQTELYKQKRTLLRQQLLDDMERLKSGDIQLEELNIRLRSQLQGEDGTESAGNFSPESRRSMFSEFPTSRKQPISRIIFK